MCEYELFISLLRCIIAVNVLKVRRYTLLVRLIVNIYDGH